MESSGKREVYLDGLKTFALLMVFALHTQRGVEVTDPCHDPVFFYAARCCMPLFFMVNGTLILRKRDFTFAYYKAKLYGIARILFIWGWVTVAYKLLVPRIGLLLSLKEGVKAALGYTDVLMIWFFYTFILLYTILLFAFPYIKKHIWKITAALGILCVLVELGSLISIANEGFFLQQHVTQRLRLWTWLFYFCFGYALSTVEKSRIKTPHIYVAAGVMTALCVVWQYVLCWRVTGQIESNYMYDDGLIILWSAALYLSFRRGERLPALFARFAGPSFGAFLIHAYFIDALGLRAWSRGPWSALLVWALLVVGCWSISWAVGKIPVVKEAFRY